MTEKPPAAPPREGIVCCEIPAEPRPAEATAPEPPGMTRTGPSRYRGTQSDSLHICRL